MHKVYSSDVECVFGSFNSENIHVRSRVVWSRFRPYFQFIFFLFSVTNLFFLFFLFNKTLIVTMTLHHLIPSLCWAGCSSGKKMKSSSSFRWVFRQLFSLLSFRSFLCLLCYFNHRWFNSESHVTRVTHIVGLFFIFPNKCSLEYISGCFKHTRTIHTDTHIDVSSDSIASNLFKISFSQNPQMESFEG